MSADVIVIGAGVDALVCAAYLARDGRRVLVLDERAPDVNFAGLDLGWIPPGVARDLPLSRHGLEIRQADPWATAPLPGGGYLQLWREPARSADSIRRVSPRDAARWPAFCERMARLARLLETLYAAPPPDPVAPGLTAAARLGTLALRLRAAGRQDVEDFLRLLPAAAADWLDDWFECDALKGLLGGAAIAHYGAGPRADGTGFRLLHHHVGAAPGVFGAPVSNIRAALAGCGGFELRRGAAVRRIGVRDGRVSGVMLDDGEELAAPRVVSGACPRRTLVELLEPGWLDPEALRSARRIRRRGVVALATLALEREPAAPALEVAPSVDYLERAADAAKYGRISTEPYLRLRALGRAADGRHRVEAHVQYAPYALLEGAWNAEGRAALGGLAKRTLLRGWPDAGAVEVESVLSPPDLEAVAGWPEGQAYQADLALDQAFWMRPMPGWAHYCTPLAGLYLCGAGTHPCGGIAGAAGAHAARAIRRAAAGGGA